MLLIDVFLSRYDDLVDILRGSELKSQLDSTEFQVRLWVPKTLESVRKHVFDLTHFSR
jgi:hypothetical protein